MLEFAFAELYLWAGLTVTYALWQIEKISAALGAWQKSINIETPEPKCPISTNPAVVLTLTFIWPIVLLMWLWQWRNE